MKNKILIISILCFLPKLTAGAGTGTDAGIVMKFNANPRAEAMGEAYAGISDDAAGAAGWNPAGLGNMHYQKIQASFYKGIVDDSFGALSYSRSISDDLFVGGTLLYYNGGGFDLTDFDGNETHINNAQEDVLAVLTGAYKLRLWTEDIMVGMNAKFLNSTLLEDVSAQAIAVDIGVMYRFLKYKDEFRLGLAVRNVGTTLKYAEKGVGLPLGLMLGSAYTMKFSRTQQLLLAADLFYEPEDRLKANFGLEYKLFDMIALRLGYKLGYEIQGFTTGVGFEYQGFQLDYVLGYKNILNSTHKVSLGYVFGIDTLLKATHDLKAAVTPRQEQVVATVKDLRIIDVLPEYLVLNGGISLGVNKGDKGQILTENGEVVSDIKVVAVFPDVCCVEVKGIVKIDKSMKAKIKGKSTE